MTDPTDTLAKLGKALSDESLAALRLAAHESLVAYLPVPTNTLHAMIDEIEAARAEQRRAKAMLEGFSDEQWREIESDAKDREAGRR